MGRIRKWIAGLLIAGMVTGTAGCGLVVTETGGEQNGSQSAEQGSDFVSAGKDTSGRPRPQDDFYGYVNKEYLDSLEVGYSAQAVDTFEDTQKAVYGELYGMITEIAGVSEDYAPGSGEQLVKACYNQLFDMLTGKKTGAKEHFAEVAGQIRAARTLADVKELIRRLSVDEGVNTYFAVDVYPNYFDGQSYALTIMQKEDFAGFEMKEIYTDDDVRKKLRSYAMNVLIAAGADVEEAKRKADELVYFVMDISCNTDYLIQKEENPCKVIKFMKNEAVDAVLGENTQEELLEMYGLKNPYGGWMVVDVEQLRYMSDAFCEDNVEVLKICLLCELTAAWTNYLRTDYAFLEGYGGDLREEPGMLAMMETDRLLERWVSRLYAESFYTEEMDAQIHRMYDDIVASYRTLMREADWLTKETRDRLIRKLEHMNFVCGGGRFEEDDAGDAGLIGSDAFETMRRIKVREREDARNRIGTKKDRSVASMDSFTVNAVYSMSNTFTIPVGIMHAPFFDVDADYAANLGGLGFAMAHEIGHAFDSINIDFDENGAYDPDGICEEDHRKLAERLRQMEEYYSSFAVMGIYYVDGEKTSGENYADKGAMECMMRIAVTNEDREKLFSTYARTWCMLVEDNMAIEMLDEDVHSPNMIRANAVLSSTDEFYELYGVQPEDGMYIAPEKRVSRYK